MRFEVIALATAASLLIGGCVYADLPVTLDSTITILDNATGKPIAGANVTVYWSADRSYQVTAVTGADGVVHLLPVLHHDTRLGPNPYPFTADGIKVTVPGYRTYDLSGTATGAIPKRCEIVRLVRVTEPEPNFFQSRACDEPLHPAPPGTPSTEPTRVIAGLRTDLSTRPTATPASPPR